MADRAAVGAHPPCRGIQCGRAGLVRVPASRARRHVITQLDVYVEAGEEVDRFTLAWTHLITQALGPAESATMISTLAKEQP